MCENILIATKYSAISGERAKTSVRMWRNLVNGRVADVDIGVNPLQLMICLAAMQQIGVRFWFDMFRAMNEARRRQNRHEPSVHQSIFAAAANSSNVPGK
jgi:hypothetical protein